MIDPVTKVVAEEMTAQFIVQPDGRRVFLGSPRPMMERNGASSGRRYRNLYHFGFRRHRRGKNTVWIVQNQDDHKPDEQGE